MTQQDDPPADDGIDWDNEIYYRDANAEDVPHAREPINISGAEFIEPPPEIAAAFSETFAQARARVAREEAETEGSVSNMEPSESTEALEDNPACPTCGTTLQEVLYGMPTAEDAHSGKYLIMGCTILDDSPSEKWFCPKCGMFVA